MSKPTGKDSGTKVEPDKKDSSGGGSNILVSIITTVLICSIFVGINYVMLKDFTKNMMKTNEKVETEEAEETETDTILHGLILDLGEFTMNLADVTPKAYLKAEVAIEVTYAETDKLEVEPKKSGGHGGHGGGEAAPDPKELIAQEMEKFKPAIRDAIITVLSSKTSDELASITGKELAKEQITEQVNAIFSGEREVIRVSFGQFIMQQGRS